MFVLYDQIMIAVIDIVCVGLPNHLGAQEAEPLHLGSLV